MTEKPKDLRTVMLKRIRLSFTDALVEKKASSKENPDRKTHHFNIIEETGGKYSAENRAKIEAALIAAGEKQWKNPKAAEELLEDNPARLTWKKGERFKNKETGKVYAGYEGNMAFSVSGPGGGQKRPRLLDKYKRPVEHGDIADVFAGGYYADVIVSFYGTDKGSRGIFATCELIRSHQEGELLGGGFVLDDSMLDELDDLDDGDDGIDTPSATASDLTALL